MKDDQDIKRQLEQVLQALRDMSCPEDSATDLRADFATLKSYVEKEIALMTLTISTIKETIQEIKKQPPPSNTKLWAALAAVVISLIERLASKS